MINVPVSVKDALRDGRMKKNYRIIVLNDDGTADETIEPIDNNCLVSESVNIDERMCSGDTIKFGLCEGSSLEFQYFDRPNLTGRRIQVFIDVDYGAENPYTIPMGFFDVKNCARQASTGIMKATAYNKLQSDYLDAKANEDILNIVAKGEAGFPSGVTYYYLLNQLLEGYSIDNREDTPVTINTRGEGRSVIYSTSWGGSSDIAQEYATFRLFKREEGYPDRTLGFYSFVRKSVISGTRLPSQPSGYGDALPSEYNRATFNSEISQRIYKGFDDLFGDYHSTEYEEYYLEPTLIDDIRHYFIFDHGSWSDIDDDKPYYSMRGKSYKLEDVRASLGSQEMLWETPFLPTAPLTYSDQNTYIDSIFKGLVAIDRDDSSGGNYPYLRIKQNLSSAQLYKPYRFPEFITPLKDNSTNYYWNNDAAFYDMSNCAYLVLPSEVFAFRRGESTDINQLFKSIYEYPWNNEGEFDFELEVQHKTLSDIEKLPVYTAEAEKFPDVTLRDLQSAVYETQCQFGQLSRETDLFSGVELNRSRLLPQETLYPDNARYPDGAQASANKSTYSQLWADEGNVHKWRYLIITYKGLDGELNEGEFTLQKTINEDGTDNYNMSDNWLFKNLVWTHEQIEAYAEAMKAKMQSITWFPFEMWCAGLPYLETGDEIEIPLEENSYTSYVLERQLKGIQNLQDTYINGTLDIF